MQELCNILASASNFVKINLSELAGSGTSEIWPSIALRWAAGRATNENTAPEIQALNSALQADEASKTLLQKRLIAPLGGSMLPLKIPSVSAALIVAHIEGLPAEEALTRLYVVATENRADGFLVRRIDGLEVTERIQIDDLTEIVPRKDIPKRREVLPVMGTDPYGEFADATTAIIRKVAVAPLFEPPYAPSTQTWRTTAIEELCEVEHAVAIASAGAAMGLELTATFRDGLLDAFQGGGSSFSMKSRSRFPTEPAILSGDEISEALLLLRSFKRSGRDAASIVEIVADRIVGARKGSTAADRALDLGIALESLLMIGEGKLGEIAYKMRTRAAWLVGADAESRLLVLRWLRSIYDLRSAVAHGAAPPESIPVGNRAVPISEALDWGSKICAHIALSVFKLGPSIRWDNIVLGGSVPPRDNADLLAGLRNAGSERARA